MIQNTILGIDPGTKEMGFAILRDRRLVTYGVHTLRNGERPYDVIGQARRKVLELVAAHRVATVAIEAPLMIPTRRAALLSVIADELMGRSRELGLRVRIITPGEARKAVAGNPATTKLEVAEKLVGAGFGELKPLLPVRPARAALGWRPRDRYWLHAFDALALAVTAQELDAERTRSASLW